MWFESIVVIVDVGFWYKKSKDSKKWFLGLALWLKMQQDHSKRWFFFNSRLIFHEKIGVRFKFIFRSVWWLDDFAWLCFLCSWRGNWWWLGGQKGKIDIFFLVCSKWRSFKHLKTMLVWVKQKRWMLQRRC